ncbi:hypothetical protein [Ralstonia solanacearum]|uniref:hypothetical protein n=1 Tax=Ralstonia solanacearum TaxID=305 RepID=UPI0005AC3CC7|nr:hypothetical protein [Ralstonia solanacearum]MDC6177146.1 hypothetical protein [Ralstonia solanacearum]MDC6238322.1 hypothetical protein [Ralstonia solanacearum]
MKITAAVTSGSFAQTDGGTAHAVQAKTYATDETGPKDAHAYGALRLSDAEVAAILQPAADTAAGKAVM